MKLFKSFLVLQSTGKVLSPVKKAVDTPDLPFRKISIADAVWKVKDDYTPSDIKCHKLTGLDLYKIMAFKKH